MMSVKCISEDAKRWSHNAFHEKSQLRGESAGIPVVTCSRYCRKFLMPKSIKSGLGFGLLCQLERSCKGNIHQIVT